MVFKKVHGKELDITENEIRYRLIQPSKVDVVGRKKIKEGVSIIVGCPKGNIRKGRCQTGTKAQALRFDRKKFTPEKAARWIKNNWRDK